MCRREFLGEKHLNEQSNHQDPKHPLLLLPRHRPGQPWEERRVSLAGNTHGQLLEIDSSELTPVSLDGTVLSEQLRPTWNQSDEQHLYWQTPEKEIHPVTVYIQYTVFTSNTTVLYWNKDGHFEIGVMFLFFVWPFYVLYWSDSSRYDRKQVEREGEWHAAKCPRPGLKHRAAAARIKPLYMGRPLHQLS